MENEKIIKIYRFESPNQTTSYIFSSMNPKDYLRFRYHILTQNQENEPIIYEANNTIELLQKNKINLISIPKDQENPEYQIFLTKLSEVTDKRKKKEEVFSRK